jgi:hypothetical protein
VTVTNVGDLVHSLALQKAEHFMHGGAQRSLFIPASIEHCPEGGNRSKRHPIHDEGDAPGWLDAPHDIHSDGMIVTAVSVGQLTSGNL